jgi:site-specific DNA-cytosine methylase
LEPATVLAMLATWGEHLRELVPLSSWTRPVRLATDCSGTGSPEMALMTIQPGGFDPDLVFACDILPCSRTFLRENVQPTVLFKDLNGRKFEHDSIVGETVDGKTIRITRRDSDLDLYVVGFPCTPFSTRGTRKGFADVATKTFWQVTKTITVIRPRIAILENVMGIVRGNSLKTVLHTLTSIRGYFWDIP